MGPMDQRWQIECERVVVSHCYCHHEECSGDDKFGIGVSEMVENESLIHTIIVIITHSVSYHDDWRE